MVPLLRRATIASALLLSTLGAVGCATYNDELARGIRYYEDKDHRDYDRSLALFRALEPDIDSLKPDDRVRYYYYRGMTDYRLMSKDYDVSADARHWLGLAHVAQKDTPTLSDEQKNRLEAALDRLNKRVYGGSDADDDLGSAEVNAKTTNDERSDEPKPAEKKKKKPASDD